MQRIIQKGILNGCMNFQDMHSRRHDRIVNHIHHQLTTTNSDLIVFNNRIVNAVMFNSESEGLYGNLIHLKPDLIVIDKSEMKVFVVEISTPLDAFINQCYQTKVVFRRLLVRKLTIDGNVLHRLALRQCEQCRRKAKSELPESFYPQEILWVTTLPASAAIDTR